MSLTFFKYVGAGNDFVFINHTDLHKDINRNELATRVCDHKWGVGADGLVIFKPLDLDKSEFEWDFYNNDGSAAEMCGNAARCAVLFVHNEFKLNSCRLLTKIGWVTGKLVGPNEISTSWQIESTQPQEKEIQLSNDQTVAGSFINTGVPHFVVESESFNGRNCLLSQDHPEFAPHKTNVTLLWEKEGRYFTKSFERGVRQFTLACGTGVMAAACVLKSKHSSNNFELNAPGGTLNVRFLENSIELTGPAQKVFKGQLY